MRTVIIDASNLILGRMASEVAKMLLNGDNVVIVNAEECIMSGDIKSAINRAQQFLKTGSPKYGPFHSRRPDLILRRSIRGMLPCDKQKGRLAYKRLKVYIGIPEELGNKSIRTIERASATKLRGPFFKLKDLAKAIGWKES